MGHHYLQTVLKSSQINFNSKTNLQTCPYTLRFTSLLSDKGSPWKFLQVIDLFKCFIVEDDVNFWYLTSTSSIGTAPFFSFQDFYKHIYWLVWRIRPGVFLLLWLKIGPLFVVVSVSIMILRLACTQTCDDIFAGNCRTQHKQVSPYDIVCLGRRVAVPPLSRHVADISPSGQRMLRKKVLKDDIVRVLSV